jgi:hypothetical protein
MRVEIFSLAGAVEAIRSDQARSDAYFELIDLLEELDVRRHGKKKSRAEYVWDQTDLIARARGELAKRGWTRDTVIVPSATSFESRLAPVKADTIKGDVQVIFEFGNRASYAYNTLTRVALGCAVVGVAVTVFVVPRIRFANAIDSNLASFERLAGEFKRLQDVGSTMVPGPLVILGVEPDE